MCLLVILSICLEMKNTPKYLAIHHQIHPPNQESTDPQQWTLGPVLEQVLGETLALAQAQAL